MWAKIVNEAVSGHYYGEMWKMLIKVKELA
jgi:hypothetical protein